MNVTLVITGASKVKTNYGNKTMTNEQNQSDIKAHPVDAVVMCSFYRRNILNFIKVQWKENIKSAIGLFLMGVIIASGFRAVEWYIPAKPAEYRICVKDAKSDYVCEVYK